MSQKLFENFKKSNKKDWIEKATKDLKGEDPLEKFKWDLESDLAVLPYYDQKDIESIDRSFQNRLLVTDHPTGDQRQWYNLQKIVVLDEKIANQKALLALSSGADGLIFDLKNSAPNLEFLFKEIKFEYCQVWLEISDKKSIKTLSYFIENKNFQGGVLCPENLITEVKKILEPLVETRVAITSVEDLSAPITEKISNILLATHRILQGSTEIQKDLLIKYCVTYSLGSDFFGEIAGLKALRQLFFQLARAYHVESFNPEDLHILAVSPAWENKDFDPHGNMLKGTTSAMAAIIGGCNSLYIEPADADNKMQTRIARNVSNILKEESYFNSNVDPAAGSYYVESLTDQIAKNAWNKFQIKA